MLSNEGDRLTRVVVSRPGDAYFDPSTHADNNINELADRTETQWGAGGPTCMVLPLELT